MAAQCEIRDCPAPAPTEAPTTDAPSTDATTDAPSTDATTSAPSTDATTSAPSTDATTSDPSTDATTSAPSTDATTDVPSTDATTDAPSTTTTDSTNPGPDTVEAFVATIKLFNMDDAFVTDNEDDVLTAIKDGSCNALSSANIDPSPSCSSLNLVPSSDRRGRRSLAAGEWTATVSITSSSTSRRTSSIAYFNDDSNDLDTHLTTALQNSGLGDAIASGSTLESDASAFGTSTNDDDDDDDGGESFPILIVAIVAGIVGVIAMAIVLVACRKSNARELTITSGSSGTNASIGQEFQQEPLHMFQGPGPDDL